MKQADSNAKWLQRYCRGGLFIPHKPTHSSALSLNSEDGLKLKKNTTEPPWNGRRLCLPSRLIAMTSLNHNFWVWSPSSGSVITHVTPLFPLSHWMLGNMMECLLFFPCVSSLTDNIHIRVIKRNGSWLYLCLGIAVGLCVRDTCVVFWIVWTQIFSSVNHSWLVWHWQTFSHAVTPRPAEGSLALARWKWLFYHIYCSFLWKRLVCFLSFRPLFFLFKVILLQT